MYNEEVKRKFIAEYTTSKHTDKVATRIFDAISEHEERFGRDISKMIIHELQETLSPIMGIRSKSKWMGVTIIKEYVSWCVENGLAEANDSILKVNLLGLDILRAQMVANPLHLHRSMNELFDAESDETIDNIYRCLFWLAYSGVQEEDAVVVKKSDVNLSKLAVIVDGEEYPIYREAIPTFENVIHLTHFSYKHPLYTQVISRCRVDSELLLNGVKADIDVRTVRSTLSKRVSAAVKDGRTTQKLSYSRVRLSGIFYKEYESEKAGLDVNFSKYVKELPLPEAVTKEQLLAEQRRQVVRQREFMDDYQRWKLAFRI